VDLYDLPLERRSIGEFLRLRAESHAHRPYLTIADRTYTFAETNVRSRAIARGLARRGIAEGDRVLLMAPNCAEFVFSWYACALLGAAVVPINVNLRGFLLQALIADAGVRGMVVHAGLLEAFAQLDPEWKRTIPWTAVIGGPQDAGRSDIGLSNVFDFDELAVTGGDDPEIPGDFRHLQMISYTSGTTGPAKGVMMPNAQCFASACTFMRLIGMTADDTLYTPLPLFHGLSSRMGALPALVLGARVVVDDRFSASRYWERAALCDATLGQVVHAIAPLIQAQPPGPWDRAHRVRAIFNCAYDPEFEARFGVRMTRAFSMTETSFLVYTPFPERKPGAVGRAHEDWEIALVDDQDRPVPDGTAGELVGRPHRPYICMQGYLNKPDKTVEAWRNLWFHTGDLMRRDDAGYFHYVDRKKDRIRRRGENVSSADVEHGVAAHPAIAECVALAHPDGAGEDDIRIVAVLKVDARVTPSELHAWLATRLPKFMLPRYIEFVAALPRTGTSKVEKQRLIDRGLGPDTWDALAQS